MLRLLCFPLLGLSAFATAAETHAFAISGGASWRHAGEARDVTDADDDFSWIEDYGLHLRLSTGAPSPGLIGWGALDLDWARSSGDNNRIDTVGVLYVERIPIGPLRLGLGLGSFYNSVLVDGERDKRWTIGGTATLAFDVFGPVYIEAGYDRTSFFGKETADIKTDCVFIDLGIRF
jgi:hypothetical protein